MTLLAHVGGMGWDEIAVLAVPVIALVWLQRRARRRAATGAALPVDTDASRPVRS